jgi:hypothetical protein
MNTPPLILSQFDLQARIGVDVDDDEPKPILWEDHKIHNLNCLNALWHEGQVTTEAIESQADDSGEFKLQRKWDCMGYNQVLSPYR